MSWTISLNLGSGNLQRGCEEITAQVSFDAPAELSDKNAAFKPQQIRGSLPPAPEIEQIYRQWKLLYQEFYRERSWHSIREIKIESGGITYFSEVEFNELCEQLIARLNQWLDNAPFLAIDRKLSRILNPTDEIKVIIETNDPILRRLPWHLWNFFEDYPQAELALGTLEYGHVRAQPRSRDCARILAIFGNDRGLDLDSERQTIGDLPRASTKFLESPQHKELNEQLWDKAGWDILFFAGHSQTEATTGQIFINETETITLEQLRHGLKKAIARGLKLAIFNSCDGLGLAQSLADLHIPQTIVMRESIPNQVAQEFFRYFLDAFARGESLYAAVREAREKLEPLETEYPCATWLPVICQNPAVESLTWKSLTTSKSSSSAGRKTSLSAVLLASLAATVFVTGLRQLGALQPWELATYDRLVKLRPLEAPDPRLLVVTITESDVQNQDPRQRLGSSISNRSLAKLLARLQSHQPRIVGLDIYREFIEDTTDTDLIKSMEAENSLITTCEVVAMENSEPLLRSRAFPEITQERSSFSDFPVDRDGVIRRQLIGMSVDPGSVCTANTSLSFKLAQAYLSHEGIKIRHNSEGNLQIGELVLQNLDSQAGGYQNVDDSGQQLLLNYRSSPTVAKTISLTEIMQAGERELSDLVKDRAILIGTIASSFKDYHRAPICTTEKEEIPGVMIHAHMLSQILSAVEDNRPLLTWLSEAGEILLIWSCALVAGGCCYCFRSSTHQGIAFTITILLIPGIGYVAFLSGLWLPIASCFFAALLGTGTIVLQTKIALR